MKNLLLLCLFLISSHVIAAPSVMVSCSNEHDLKVNVITDTGYLSAVVEIKTTSGVTQTLKYGSLTNESLTLFEANDFFLVVVHNVWTPYNSAGRLHIASLKRDFENLRCVWAR
jgi:hypothetical protein